MAKKVDFLFESAPLSLCANLVLKHVAQLQGYCENAVYVFRF